MKVPLLVVFAVATLSACSRTDPAANRDTPADLSALTANEVIGAVKSSGGQAVLVNVWATWCGSCEHELPMLQKLAETYREKGVRVLLVSVDEATQRAEVKAFLKEHSIGLPSYLVSGALGAFKMGMNPRWTGVLPATFLFDGRGQRRYFWGGEAFENEVVPIVDGLLAGKAIDGEANLGVAPGATSDHR
jgi:thiol-disulfide isomerase/thioredoxin